MAVEIIRRTLSDGDLTRYEGIPSPTVGRALLDSRELIMRSRLVDAAHEARAEGLIRRRRFDEVMAQLEQAHA